jgi:dockerin type I repeat protein
MCATFTITPTVTATPTLNVDCLTLLPNGNAFQPQNDPIGCQQNFQCVQSDDGDATYVRSGQTAGGPEEDLYTLTAPTPRTEPIAAVRLNIVGRSVNGNANVAVIPQLALGLNAPVARPQSALTSTYATTTALFLINPDSNLPWTWDDVSGLRAGFALSVNAIDEARVTAVSVDVCWSPPTPTATVTATPSSTPTVTLTRTPTRTATLSATPTLTATPTVTPTPIPSSTPASTSTPTVTPSVLPSPSPTLTLTATATETPSPAPPTPTPSPTASAPTDTPTASPTPPPTTTVSASVTPSRSPSPTGTRPTATPTALPRVSYIIGRGDNEWQCAFDLQSGPPLLLSSGTTPMSTLAIANPETLRSIYQAIYIAPGLGLADYDLLRLMSSLGGSLEQFVSLGGVAVMNLAGINGDQMNVAPGGVGFAAVAQHDAETILLPDHPYITGMGLGGEALGPSDLSSWQPTDYGTLTNLPADATVVLENTDGPSWAEYSYGAGRVIVTSIGYCYDANPESQGAATRNLFRYGRFYLGSAQTPAPTVTTTPTFTATSSRTPTRSRTPTPTGTRLPSATPTPLAGDVNGDGSVDELDFPLLLDALFADPPPSGSDVNGDGAVTAADISAFLILLSEGF